MWRSAVVARHLRDDLSFVDPVAPPGHGAVRIALSLPRTDRVILDESGWLPPFSPAGAALRFHRLSRLYEHASAMVMSTLDFADWSSAFGASKVTTALLDRLTHHCHIVEAGNPGDRFLHGTAVARNCIRAGAQAR